MTKRKEKQTSFDIGPHKIEKLDLQPFFSLFSEFSP